MPELTLDEENSLSRAGVADRTFADHSGNIQQGYELGSLTRGLVAYYPMEEGQGQVLHDGALDNLGQINGASWSGTGAIGQDSVTFSTNGDNINCGTIGSIEGGPESGTISFWATLTDDTITHYFVTSESDATTGDWSIRFNDNIDIVNILIRGSSDDIDLNKPAGMFDGSPHLHTFVITSSNNVNYYFDGNKQATDTSGADFSTNDDVFLGYQDNFGTSMDGDLDDVRIYDRPLSQPEIEALYNLGQPSGFLVEERDVPSARPDVPPSVADPSALARYEFENDVTDSWGNFDGTDNTSAGFVDGVYGQAKDFDASNNDYVSNVKSIDKPPVTISLWANRDDSSTNRVLYGSYTGSLQVQLSYNSSNDVYGWFTFGDGTTHGIEHNESVASAKPNNEWAHLVATHDGERYRLYINGSLSDEDVDPVFYDTGLDEWIGSRNDSGSPDQSYDGQIDDVRIYSRALDPIEVETLFNKGAYRIKRSDI